MQKTLFIVIMSAICFLAEFVVFQVTRGGFKPNFLLLFVVFTSLYFGIRYGIGSAVAAGIIIDSFAPGYFGIHVLAFLLCAYMTVYLKKIIYMVGSQFSRVLLIAVIYTINFITLYFLNFIFQPLNLFTAIVHVYLPELIFTVLLASSVFKGLKLCVLKFTI